MVRFGKINVIGEVVTAVFALERRIGISRIAIWNRVQRMASVAAIKHPVTPHGLRPGPAPRAARKSACQPRRACQILRRSLTGHAGIA